MKLCRKCSNGAVLVVLRIVFRTINLRTTLEPYLDRDNCFFCLDKKWESESCKIWAQPPPLPKEKGIFQKPAKKGFFWNAGKQCQVHQINRNNGLLLLNVKLAQQETS